MIKTISWLIKFWWRRIIKLNYIIVYENSNATYVNAYEAGRIVDSEIFWKEDYTKAEDKERLKNIDLSIKYMNKTYKIKKIYNETFPDKSKSTK